MSGLLITALTACALAAASLFFSKRKIERTEEYVLARNSLGPGAMSFSLFATGMGVWILFGPAEALLTAGVIALCAYALSSTLSLWVFGIIGARIREALPAGTTLTEYVRMRFGTAMYALVLAVTFVYMGIAIAAGLSGIGLAGQIIFGMPAWQTIAIVGLATLSYTMLGGFRASVVAGKVQTLVILPLFALVVLASAFIAGDFGAAWSAARIPAVGWPDFDYGLGLLIGIISAEAFDQMWWQHVYSGKGTKAMRRGFTIAGFLVFPVVLIAGLVGVYAAASGTFAPATAVFDFLATMPAWLSTSAMVLAIALVMGNTDSLLNGMVSVVTVDVRRLWPTMSEHTLLTLAKFLTVLFALAAMTLASAGFSVLYLFLIADLICAGVAFPVFYGMFSPGVGKRIALIAALFGIAAGAVLFPDPSFTRGDLGLSFLAALVVPAVLVVGYRAIWRTSSSS